ncbi:2927_t:CDS:2, partial [Acaulospora colombiana]
VVADPKAGSLLGPGLKEQPPTLFALLIGIDKYLNPQYRLQGAVKDAKEMEDYLSTSFPSAQIRSLHDEAATRKSIIREIDRLIQNPSIKRQDPILIFYAGHGGETTPPNGWTSHNGKVQMLMPQDYDEDST